MRPISNPNVGFLQLGLAPTALSAKQIAPALVSSVATECLEPSFASVVDESVQRVNIDDEKAPIHQPASRSGKFGETTALTIKETVETSPAHTVPAVAVNVPIPGSSHRASLNATDFTATILQPIPFGSLARLRVDASSSQIAEVSSAELSNSTLGRVPSTTSVAIAGFSAKKQFAGLGQPLQQQSSVTGSALNTDPTKGSPIASSERAPSSGTILSAGQLNIGSSYTAVAIGTEATPAVAIGVFSGLPESVLGSAKIPDRGIANISLSCTESATEITAPPTTIKADTWGSEISREAESNSQTPEQASNSNASLSRPCAAASWQPNEAGTIVFALPSPRTPLEASSIVLGKSRAAHYATLLNAGVAPIDAPSIADSSLAVAQTANDLNSSHGPGSDRSPARAADYTVAVHTPPSISSGELGTAAIPQAVWPLRSDSSDNTAAVGVITTIGPPANMHDVRAATAAATPDSDSHELFAPEPLRTATATPVLDPSNPGQFVTGAELARNGGRSEMHIAMQTDSLGNIELHTRVSGDSVGAAITVEKRDAHTALAIELPALQLALSEKQLRVEQITLLHAPLHSSGDESSPQQFDGHPNAGRRQSGNSSPAPTTPVAGFFSGSGTMLTEATDIFDSHGRLSVRA